MGIGILWRNYSYRWYNRLCKTADPNSSGWRINEWYMGSSIAVQDHFVWIGTATGLYVYDSQNNKYVDTRFDTVFHCKAQEINVAKIFKDALNRIWVLCDGVGVAMCITPLQQPSIFIPSVKLNDRYSNAKLEFWDGCVANNCLYLASSWGLRTIYLSKHSFFTSHLPPSLSQFQNKEVIACAVSANSNLFFSQTITCMSIMYKVKLFTS